MVRAYRAAEIQQAVRRLAAGRPVPAVDVELQLAVLELQEKVEGRVAAPPLSEEEARARIEAGQPLTDGFRVGATGELRRAAEQICELLGERRSDLARALDAVRRELARAGADVGAASADAAALPTLYPAVVTLALRGLLRPWAIALSSLVDEQRWLRPECPVCGGAPDVAVMLGPARERRLLCSQCDAEWAYSRIGCPFCGTDEPEKLGYYAADAGPYRLYVCDGCRGYVKSVDIPCGEDRCPPAERVFAAPLDVAAARLGYSTAW